MLNKILLQGRLVADPELRQTPTGVSVATFRIACDRDFKNKDTGEKDCDFITIVVWRSTAEFVSKYFQKGDMIILVGRLQMRNYTDKEGNKRTAAEVVADNVYFGGSKKSEDSHYNDYGCNSYSAPAESSANATAPSGNNFAELSDDDSELPF